MTYSVWTALRFALFVLMLAERLDLTVVSALCTIDNVLVEGSVDTAGVSTTEVNVHALGHCHNKDTVATILKKADPENSVSMQTRLTHHSMARRAGGRAAMAFSSRSTPKTVFRMGMARVRTRCKHL